MLEKIDNFLYDKFPQQSIKLYQMYYSVRNVIKNYSEIIKHIKCLYKGEVYVDVYGASWSFDDYLLVDTLPGVLDRLIDETVEGDLKQQLIHMRKLCSDYKEVIDTNIDYSGVSKYLDRIETRNDDGSLTISSQPKPGMEIEYQKYRSSLDKQNNELNEKRLAIQKGICIMLSKHLDKMWW